MIGINIGRVRKRWRMSQAELGLLLRCTRNMVANFETGRSVPDIDTVARLEMLCGVDLHTREVLLSDLPTGPIEAGAAPVSPTQLVDIEQRMKNIESLLHAICAHLGIQSSGRV